MIQPPTRDVIDDARRFTDQDIRAACSLIDALDGDVNAAIHVIELAERMRNLVKESGK